VRGRSTGFLTMSALVRATGSSRATVHHYVSLGLLPAPVKTAQNMAYYAPECIERLRCIRALREREVPLVTVRALLDAHGVEGTWTLLRQATAAGQAAIALAVPGERAMSTNELTAATGLAKEDLEDLESIGIARRQEDGMYDGLTVQIAEALGRMRAAGLTEEAGFRPADLRLYRDAMAQLLRHELEYFTARLFGRVPPDRAPAVVRAALAHAEHLWVLVHRRLLSDAIRTEVPVRGIGSTTVSAPGDSFGTDGPVVQRDARSPRRRRSAVVRGRREATAGPSGG